MLHSHEPIPEPCRPAAQRTLGIDAPSTRHHDCAGQQVSERTLGFHRSPTQLQAIEGLSHHREPVGVNVGIQPHARSLAVQLVGEQQRREARADAINQRRTRTFGLLDLLPVREDIGPGLGFGIAEHMGVATHEFVVDSGGNVTQIERAGLGREDRMEHHLKQQVAEFIFDPCVGIEIHFAGGRVTRQHFERFDRFVSLFEEIARE